MTTDLPAYDGRDMTGHMLRNGFVLCAGAGEVILSMTNVRDRAVMVTDRAIYVVKPARGLSFFIECVAAI